MQDILLYMLGRATVDAENDIPAWRVRKGGVSSLDHGHHNAILKRLKIHMYIAWSLGNSAYYRYIVCELHGVLVVALVRLTPGFPTCTCHKAYAIGMACRTRGM
jgi:hypothetical protein